MRQEQEVHPREISWTYRIVKRLLDIILGSILLLISAPVVLVAALAIRIETKGSPIFIQRRVGHKGKTFLFYKLRGMYCDARDRYPDLYNYAKHEGLNFHFHYVNDPRITKVGVFTRRTSIDELPNFLNVVLGDLTLVGPRPEVPDVMDLYGNYRNEYLSVKPGVTCVSKISGRDRLTKEETILLDLSYIRQMSLGLDLKILWTTFKGVLMRKDVFGGITDHKGLTVDDQKGSDFPAVSEEAGG